jgi:hypothetical protein
MKAFLISRVSAQPRRIALLLALTGALFLGVVQVEPASAWTVERTPDKIVIQSERLSASKVRATVYVAFFSSGNYEFKVELHNTARIARTYRVGGEVRVGSLGLVFSYDSGGWPLGEQRSIEGKRNDDWDTIYGRGHHHRLLERWNEVDMGTVEAHFWLGASWNATHDDKNRWDWCLQPVCDL